MSTKLAEEMRDERDVRRAVAPHQHDFPYERGEEAHVTRREFCNFLALTSTALLASAVGFAAKAALDSRHTETFAPAKVETVEAALARSYGELLPLVIASAVCWVISLSVILWRRPASRRHTSTGYIREGRR